MTSFLSSFLSSLFKAVFVSNIDGSLFVNCINSAIVCLPKYCGIKVDIVVAYFLNRLPILFSIEKNGFSFSIAFDISEKNERKILLFQNCWMYME
jgi:hypothetical protein